MFITLKLNLLQLTVSFREICRKLFFPTSWFRFRHFIIVLNDCLYLSHKQSNGGENAIDYFRRHSYSDMANSNRDLCALLLKWHWDRQNVVPRGLGGLGTSQRGLFCYFLTNTLGFFTIHQFQMSQLAEDLSVALLCSAMWQAAPSHSPSHTAAVTLCEIIDACKYFKRWPLWKLHF